ncbi:uncharacterized protein LOC126844839 [Adelges cooleyi]|uniref:uncharacterized protein LOC126844839 n=1 Tax=Adelges cooleyi TaxID=133065 RepID=UPI00217F7AB3|nr:uncharacterized protein LOC126844839 [Adelges cooleyi]
MDTSSLIISHEDLKYIDAVPEKDDIVMEEQPSPIMRLSRVAPGAGVIALHHQTQPPPLSHHRALVGDYREPSTPVVLDTVCGRRTVNGVGDAIAAGAGGPHPQVALWHPRPVYPFPLPLPTTTTIGFWHSSQPPFPTPSATYPPYLDGEWSRHCRLPLVFNPDPQPEPVNLHNNHHRRGEPRSLEMVERPERVHNRPVQPAVQPQDNREPTRHHA